MYSSSYMCWAVYLFKHKSLFVSGTVVCSHYGRAALNKVVMVVVSVFEIWLGSALSKIIHAL